MYTNLCRKWGITPDEIKHGIDQMHSGGFGSLSDPVVVAAICDLLCDGDIKAAPSKEEELNEEFMALASATETTAYLNQNPTPNRGGQ